MKGKILIVDDLHPYFKETAQQMGYQVDDCPRISREETLARIGEYVGIAVRTKFRIDQQLIAAGKQLQFIARAGAGLDNIDQIAAAERNIVLLAANEGNCDAVGEHSMGLLLMLLNHLRKADAEVRNGIWDREGNRGYELAGKTVGIVGYGFMGQSLARKLQGFNVKVLAYDKYKSGFTDTFATEADMPSLCEQADILSLHIPLTEETRQMVGKQYIEQFKKPFFLLNTARGEIVNTSELLEQIDAGRILGAGLDVLEVEKFPALQAQDWYSKLIHNTKVVLSPHVAGWTFDSYRKISEVLAKKLSQIQ